MADTAAPAKAEGSTTKRAPRKSAGTKPPATTSGKKRGPKNMTDEHKRRMQEGRTVSKVVKTYLAALEVHRPKRGRKVTKESMEAQIADIENKLAEAKPIERLKLIQRKMDLTANIEALADEFDLAPLEAEFVRVGKEYARGAKISKKAFIAIGVPADVLKKAGI